MKEEKTTAIVLRSFDYKEHQRIITIFTSEMGLINLIVKGINTKNSYLFSLTTPFTVGEYHFSKGRSELYQYLDGTHLETLPLRENLVHLRAASTIIKAVLASQLPGKPSPKLYLLTLTYLKQIPLFSDPAPLVASYHLKLLKHDGLTRLSAPCSLCAREPTHIHTGEAFCYTHASEKESFFFTKGEWTLLMGLQDSRKFDLLQQLSVGELLQEKIESYFLNRIKQYS